MNRKKLYLLVGIAVAACIAFSCEDGNKKDEVNFNRKAMLEHLATSIIVPNYDTLQASFIVLKQSAETFSALPSESNLTTLRSAWLATYKAWQGCAPFEFGPAMEVSLKSSLNTYPTDIEQIEDNIFEGGYNLNQAANLDAIGLPAIEYLLYYGTNQEILTALQLADRQQYLMDLIDHAQTKVNTVSEAWSGTYQTTFANASGTDIGSGLGMLVNELNRDYELIKNYKVGIPLGKKSLGEPFPEKVEAYYSAHSVELALINLETIINIFTGDVNGEEGLGLEEHLDAVDAQYNNQALSEAIMAQFTKGKTALESIEGSLSDAIVNQEDLVNDAYVELQATVALLKVDLPSALGVLITYQDNDGD